eukprot:3559500-Rhodomonas_salina.2
MAGPWLGTAAADQDNTTSEHRTWSSSNSMIRAGITPGLRWRRRRTCRGAPRRQTCWCWRSSRCGPSLCVAGSGQSALSSSCPRPSWGTRRVLPPRASAGGSPSASACAEEDVRRRGARGRGAWGAKLLRGIAPARSRQLSKSRPCIPRSRRRAGRSAGG